MMTVVVPATPVIPERSTVQSIKLGRDSISYPGFRVGVQVMLTS